MPANDIVNHDIGPHLTAFLNAQVAVATVADDKTLGDFRKRKDLSCPHGEVAAKHAVGRYCVELQAAGRPLQSAGRPEEIARPRGTHGARPQRATVELDCPCGVDGRGATHSYFPEVLDGQRGITEQTDLGRAYFQRPRDVPQ